MSVEKRVVSVIRDQLGIPEERITRDLFIMGEIDSPDHVELIIGLGEEFGITTPDEDAVKIETVAQAIHYIEAHTERYRATHIKKESLVGPEQQGSLWDWDLDG